MPVLAAELTVAITPDLDALSRGMDQASRIVQHAAEKMSPQAHGAGDFSRIIDGMAARPSTPATSSNGETGNTSALTTADSLLVDGGGWAGDQPAGLQGAITAAAGLRQSLEAVSATAATLDQQLDLDRLLAPAASDALRVNSNLTQACESGTRARSEFQAIEVSLGSAGIAADGLGNDFEHSFQSAFRQVGQGWKATVDQFVTSFLRGLDQMVAAAVSADLTGALFGTQGGSTPTGGLLGWLAGAVGAGAGTGANGFDLGSLSDAGIFAASGGLISGPGASTSDSIPARLSSGEYVLSARAVNRFGVPALDAMNKGQVPVSMSAGATVTHVYNFSQNIYAPTPRLAPESAYQAKKGAIDALIRTGDLSGRSG